MRLIVRATPEPPRSVGFWDVAKRLYRMSSSRILLAAGVLIGIFSVALTAAPGPLPALIAAELILAPLALVFLFAPMVRAARAREAIRHGKLRAAIVRSVEVFPPRKVAETIDAYNNGMAHGELGIPADATRTTLRFKTDAPWATAVAEGTVVLALVNASETELLILLGPDVPLGSPT